MLRFAEETLLLTLDDKTGKIRPLPDSTLVVALAGALLMELAFSNRIDADPGEIRILDRSQTGDSLADFTIACLPTDRDTVPTTRALAMVALRASDVIDDLFDALVSKGILKRRGGGVFEWVLGERRYPLIDRKEIAEVRTRIRAVLLSDTIPSPRDVVIIALIDACDLYDAIFIRGERTRARQRAAAVGKMDLIGREIASAAKAASSKPLEELAAANH